MPTKEKTMKAQNTWRSLEMWERNLWLCRKKFALQQCSRICGYL